MSSEYEKNVVKLIEEKLEQLESMKRAQVQDTSQVNRLNDEIQTLEALFENYNLGMNYFRRARGGRSGLREGDWFSAKITK
jgi:hypothetical protein